VTYQQFAHVYDRLMEDVPYEKWVTLTEKMTSKYLQSSEINLFDLACGTGTLTSMLAKSGFRVKGADLSEEMLTIAQQKASEQGLNIPFYQQDMSKLESLPNFDCITIFCDSLNYLKTDEQVEETFRGVHEHLQSNGLFLFDVHSIYKITQVFMNQTFADNDDDVSLIWHCFPGEFPNSVDHSLTFFVKDNEREQYHRFDEWHSQRTYSIEQYKTWLNQSGFNVLEIVGDFGESASLESSERILFVAQKK
jgi:SAM-dependent methyltransferase